MREIRRFQEEREAWEARCNELETANEWLTREKTYSEEEIARLYQEVEELKNQPKDGGYPSGPSRPPIDAQTAKTHHEQYLELMAQIDALRGDLQQEQLRCRAFERRATEAEVHVKKLSSELEKKGGSSILGTMDRLDVTMSCRDVQRAARDLPLEDALSVTQRGLESKHQEVLSLEDENLKLREDLNLEKQKNLELKRESQRRKAMWKEELEKIQEDLHDKHRLEERANEQRIELQHLEAEVARLKMLEARLQQELGASSDREQDAKRVVEKLERELDQACQAKDQSQKTADSRVAEMQTLATAVSGQLVAVEQELTEKVRKNSHLFELFLHHARAPTSKIRQYARDMAAAGEAGWDLRMKPAPPLFDPTVCELQDNLVKLVNILRFASEVLESSEHRKMRHLQAQLQGELGGS